ncbi:MAG: hypothetical protein GXO42_00355 [bacterium]|nr:hypothetical protein [bacterium]
MKYNVQYTIQNAVVVVDFRTRIDIYKILETFDDVEYEPTTFPGLIWKIDGPRCLLFSSGKAVIAGIKTNRVEDIKKLIEEKVVRRLREIGINVPDNFSFEIQNLVANADLGKPIDLNKVYAQKDKLVKKFNLKSISYDPESFPGMRIALGPDVGVTCLVFSSGKVVIAGAKTEECIERALEKLIDVLKEAGAL